MKRLAIALTVATLALSGCGLFGTNHAWKQANQENPLQIPPGLDRPATTAALTIPPPTAPKAAATPSASPEATRSLAANATSMHLPGDVATAYKRVGLALQHGDLGTVTAQDAVQHTYQLSIGAKAGLGTSKSFLQKHFSNLNDTQSGAATGSTDAAAAGNAGEVVMITVAPAKNGGSTVAAHGNPPQAAHVISVLNSRLGG